MLDEIEYQAKLFDNEKIIKEGLQLIINKLKSAEKWRNKK